MTYGRDERDGRLSNLSLSMISNPALSQKLHYLSFPEMLNISTNSENKKLS
jgi:hypothetical protein